MSVDQDRMEKDGARAARLLGLVKAEILEMNIHTRLMFVEALAKLCKPELDHILKEGAKR